MKKNIKIVVLIINFSISKLKKKKKLSLYFAKSLNSNKIYLKGDGFGI